MGDEKGKTWNVLGWVRREKAVAALFVALTLVVGILIGTVVSGHTSAMKTLTFSRDIHDFQFILVLVDFNQNSRLLALEKIKKLPFADQVRIFYSGFGMWEQNVGKL